MNLAMFCHFFKERKVRMLAETYLGNTEPDISAVFMKKSRIMKQYFDTSAVQIGFPLSNYGQQMRHLTVK